jgi:hypothetical protein
VAILAKEGLLGGGVEEMGDGEEQSSVLSVHKLSEISVDGFLMVDQVSMSALQIFQACLVLLAYQLHEICLS